MNNKILIIGSGGYIGQKLTDALSKDQRIKVFGPGVLDQKYQYKRNITAFKGSILESKDLEKAIDAGDIVVNLSGVTTSVNDANQQFKLNVLAQNTLLEECVKKCVGKILFISTINIYKPLGRASKENDPLDPLDIYSLTKMIAEEVYSFYSRAYKIPTIILRLGSVLGPDQQKGIIFTYARTIKDKKQIIMPKKSMYRDFIYIDDAVKVITRAISYSPKNKEVFNISSGQKISLKDLAYEVKKLVPFPIAIEFVEKDPQLAQTWVNIAKAKKLLGFKPGVRITKNLKKILSSYNIS